MNDIALRTSDAALVARLGGAEYERCVALALSPNDIANLADLTDMYEQPATALIPLMESGLSLNRVYQALEAGQNHFPDESTKSVAQLLHLVGLGTSVQLSHTNTTGDAARIEAPLGTEEARERDLARALGIEPEESAKIQERAHRYSTDSAMSAQSDVLDTFADSLRDAGGVGLPRLIKLIRNDMDGDSLRAYRLALERPAPFRRFLRGELSADALLRMDADHSQNDDHKSAADVFTGF